MCECVRVGLWHECLKVGAWQVRDSGMQNNKGSHVPRAITPDFVMSRARQVQTQMSWINAGCQRERRNGGI